MGVKLLEPCLLHTGAIISITHYYFSKGTYSWVIVATLCAHLGVAPQGHHFLIPVASTVPAAMQGKHWVVVKSRCSNPCHVTYRRVALDIFRDHAVLLYFHL